MLQGQGGALANVKINSGLLPEFNVHTDSVEYEGGHSEAACGNVDVLFGWVSVCTPHSSISAGMMYRWCGFGLYV